MDLHQMIASIKKHNVISALEETLNAINTALARKTEYFA